jgi:hypothetical protein
MSMKVAISARYMFVSVAVTALVYAGLESAASRMERVGIVSCGWEGNPCQLEPVVVTARKSAEPVVAMAPEPAR